MFFSPQTTIFFFLLEHTVGNTTLKLHSCGVFYTTDFVKAENTHKV